MFSVGKLVVIEGLDGAGKRTLAKALTDALDARGAKVATGAFPRYGEDVHADLVHDGLHGRLGDLTDSVHGMSVLYALDRRGAADRIRADLGRCDVVLLDRYIASNAPVKRSSFVTSTTTGSNCTPAPFESSPTTRRRSMTPR